MTRLWRAAPLVLALTSCTAPGQYGGSIPIDHAGLLGRWRRACELGKGSSTGGTCATGDGAPSESDESDESEAEGSGDADIRDASRDDDAPDGSGAGPDGSSAGALPARDRP